MKGISFKENYTMKGISLLLISIVTRYVALHYKIKRHCRIFELLFSAHLMPDDKLPKSLA